MATKGMAVFTHAGEDYTINDPNVENEFSASVDYAAGEYCYYQGNLYRFNSAHSGAWSGSDVTAVRVGAELVGQKTALKELSDTVGTIQKLKVNANAYHSSNNDRIQMAVAANETVYISVMCDRSPQNGFALYAYDSGENQVGAITAKNTIKAFTPTTAVVSFGLYVDNSGGANAVNFRIVIAKESQLVDAIGKSIDAVAAEITGYEQNETALKNLSFNSQANNTDIAYVEYDGVQKAYIHMNMMIINNKNYTNKYYSSENFASDFSGELETSPAGVADCLLVTDHKCLVYNFADNTMRLANTQQLNLGAQEVVMFRLNIGGENNDVLHDFIQNRKNQQYDEFVKSIGGTSKTITVAAGATHSSTLDKISIELEEGEKYVLFARSEPKLNAMQIWAYNGGGGTLLPGGINKFVAYTPAADMTSVGTFVDNTGRDEKVTVTTFIFKINDLFAELFLNVPTADHFLADGDLPYDSTAVDSKAATFNDLFIDAEETESFLFFTDPHTVNANVSDADMRKGIDAIEYAFNRTATTFCICGGDWLQDSDTKAVALNRLGYIDGFMRRKFGDYYLPILGNHDTNYQGKDQESSEANTGRLAQSALQQIWFRKYGNKMYYDHEGISSRFYIFDTGIDWDGSMSDYRWEQVNWFARKLIEKDDPHSIMFLHIFTNATKENLEADVDNNVVPLAANLFEVAQKYNAKASLTLNGQTYDFTGTTGKVAFAQCGHSHYDSIVTYKDIPTVITTNTTWQSRFDLCYVDYVAGKYKMIREGTGSDREVNIIIPS